jgi:hypothetical protein
MQPGQIRIFSFRLLGARRLHGFAKRTLRLLLFPIHLQGLFAVTFCECRFSCASDGVLPVKISIGSYVCLDLLGRSAALGSSRSGMRALVVRFGALVGGTRAGSLSKSATGQ